MKELALHILDIAENSVRAGATIIEIRVTEDLDDDLLLIEIVDNGCGMDDETLNQVLRPFFTTKTVRRVGIGLSLLRRAAERAGGDLQIFSEIGKGTRVVAQFQLSHIDRQPLGDIGSTIKAIIFASPEIEIVYHHRKSEDRFVFDTRMVKEVLDGVPITEPRVMTFISDLIRERRDLE